MIKIKIVGVLLKAGPILVPSNRIVDIDEDHAYFLVKESDVQESATCHFVYDDEEISVPDELNGYAQCGVRHDGRHIVIVFE